MATKTLGPKAFQKAFKVSSDKFIEGVTSALLQSVTGAIYERLVEVNPVLTGLSRNNWFISIDEPSEQETSDVAEVSGTGAPMTSVEKARLNQAYGEIKAKATQLNTIWITNNVHYIVYINAGTSAKAPDGIAEVAILSALSGRASNRMAELLKK